MLKRTFSAPKREPQPENRPLRGGSHALMNADPAELAEAEAEADRQAAARAPSPAKIVRGGPGAGVYPSSAIDLDDQDLDSLTIAGIAGLLNAETEALNHDLERDEQQIIADGANVPASIVLHEERGDYGMVMRTYLNFGKYDGRWCVFVHFDDDTTGTGPRNPTPILKAGRDVRMLAVAAMPKLRRAIKLAMLENLAAIKAARKSRKP
jgi:hypothetical protein